MTYRSNLKIVAINQFLEELCPLNLVILWDFTVFHIFVLSAYRYSFSIWYVALPYQDTDIHLLFGMLLCHTKIQIKFEFGFIPLIFLEVMAIGLRKIS
jgi:hypothetical protein